MARRMTHDEIVFDSRTCGSRAATRVRVNAPQGSGLNGQTGIVARQAPAGADWGTTLMVRLDQRFGGLELPFGRGELEVLG